MQFNFTIGSADDARLAAEVCDFMADRMAPGAAPAVRTRRASNKPATQADAPAVPVTGAAVAVSDAAELYAALAGGTPAATVVPEVTAPHVEPEVETAIADSRDDRVVAAREAIKAKGGLWFGDYVKKNHPDGKKLSDYTDAELAAVHAAATSAQA